MYTLYDFLKKFNYDSFNIVNRNGKYNIISKKIDFDDVKMAIEYGDTEEDRLIDTIAEKAVLKVDFEQMNIYVED
jgi:hypothetical protein